MTLLRYQRFSREHPCPICGGFDTEPRGEGRRCFGFLSTDGDFAHCTREECAGGLPLNADSSTYPHILRGDCACGVRHLVRPRPAKAKPSKGRIVATYDYHDAAGNLLFQVVRYQPKDFKCRRPDGKGGWIWNMTGVRRVLYRLPLVLEAIKKKWKVFVTEGEKDADAINKAGADGANGYIGTSCPHGAKKWCDEYSLVLAGAQVVVVADKDADGYEHASMVATSVEKHVSSCSVVEAKQGKDAYDHLAAGFTVDDFVPLDLSSEEASGDGDGAGQEEPEEQPAGCQRISQADRIVMLVEEAGVELFKDTKSDSWARVPVDGVLHTMSCRSKDFRHWLSRLMWTVMQKVPNSQAISSAMNVIESKARFEGEEYALSVRVAELDGAFWYDLTDEKWQAIRITSAGWTVVERPPILFRRYRHQRPQVIPVPGGSIGDLLSFVNLTSKPLKVLFIVYVVACLIPDIAHPVPVLHGGQGAAKTTLFMVVRRLVDPSVTETLSLPTKPEEFIQQLSHNWMPLFDNLTTLPAWMSDVFCRAVTGQGFSKRELFSDDDDVIYQFRRCCGMNGINIAATKPDLLDRAILFHLEAIGRQKRRSETAFWADFEKQRAMLFGAALDVLAKAIALRPTVILNGLPRMADFALWGCAIAQAAGYTQKEFLDAYEANFALRNQEILAGSEVADSLLRFMHGRGQWRGTASELHAELERTATGAGINVHGKAWPKAPHALTRRLNELQQNLAADGLEVVTGGTERLIQLAQSPRNSVDSVDSGESHTQSAVSADAISDAISGGDAIASAIASPRKPPSNGQNDAIDASDAISGTSDDEGSDGDEEVEI
jgi:hypothetical protein